MNTPAATTSHVGAVHTLKHADVRPGDRWVYSAGCNVLPGQDQSRVDVEVDDLGWLLGQGARVAILTHQGDHAAGSARHVPHVASRLAERLSAPVSYEPDLGEAERNLAASGANGTAVVVGNTRLHPGEQENSPRLAARYARLGDRVAVGGMSKAHRSHASNVGVLDYLPGFATASLLHEIAYLQPWCGRITRKLSVAVLGGLKSEKTCIGLPALTQHYDAVIPGGAVLTALLAAQGKSVGDSARPENFDRCVETARAILDGPQAHKVLMPTSLLLAPTGTPGRHLEAVADAARGVPPGWTVVDACPSGPQMEVLPALRARGGRLLVAGPPSPPGRGALLRPILRVAGTPCVEALLAGGDSINEVPWSAATSTGGGAVLHYLAHSTLPVLEALRGQELPC